MANLPLLEPALRAAVGSPNSPRVWRSTESCSSRSTSPRPAAISKRRAGSRTTRRAASDPARNGRGRCRWRRGQAIEADHRGTVRTTPPCPWGPPPDRAPPGPAGLVAPTGPHRRLSTALAAPYGLTFDLCLRSGQLGDVIELVRQLSEDVRFVVDHIAKPEIRRRGGAPLAGAVARDRRSSIQRPLARSPAWSPKPITRLGLTSRSAPTSCTPSTASASTGSCSAATGRSPNWRRPTGRWVETTDRIVASRSSRRKNSASSIATTRSTFYRL